MYFVRSSDLKRSWRWCTPTYTHLNSSILRVNGVYFVESFGFSPFLAVVFQQKCMRICAFSSS